MDENSIKVLKVLPKKMCTSIPSRQDIHKIDCGNEVRRNVHSYNLAHQIPKTSVDIQCHPAFELYSLKPASLDVHTNSKMVTLFGAGITTGHLTFVLPVQPVPSPQCYKMDPLSQCRRTPTTVAFLLGLLSSNR